MGGDDKADSPKEDRESAESIRLDRRSRVTVDFSGPPLELPEERSDSFPALDAVEAPSDTISLGDESGAALDLVDRAAPSEPTLELAAEMLERFALDDFTGALRIAELVLGQQPEDADALHVAKESRRRLEQLYTSRLGGMSTVPRMGIPETDIRWLGLDNRAAFLLSRVDGEHTIEELVDVSAMPRLEALKTLVSLEELGAIKI
ncbi:MAG: hypothetical protein AAGE52_03205 [Myxococcota bacterium]